MSYKSRVPGAAQEILLVEVKDLHGPNKKRVSMAYETYLTLRKEMEIKILKVMQAGKPEVYAKRRIMHDDTASGDLFQDNEMVQVPMHNTGKFEFIDFRKF